MLPEEWDDSEHRDYIISEYRRETEFNSQLIGLGEWMLSKKQNKWWDMDYTKFIQEYESLIGVFDHSMDCCNWMIDKILKYHEHVKIIPSENPALCFLRKYTKINSNIIKSIKDGSFDISHLLKPRNIDNMCEVYDDECLRDACLLFRYMDSNDVIVFLPPKNFCSGFIITSKENFECEEFTDLYKFNIRKSIECDIKEKLLKVFIDNRSKIRNEIVKIKTHIESIENEKFICSPISFTESPINLPIDQMEEFFKKKHENKNLIEKLQEELRNLNLECEFSFQEESRILNLEKPKLKKIIQMCKYFFYFNEELFKFKKYLKNHS